MEIREEEEEEEGNHVFWQNLNYFLEEGEDMEEYVEEMQIPVKISFLANKFGLGHVISLSLMFLFH